MKRIIAWTWAKEYAKDTNMVTGVPLKNRTEDEGTKGLLEIKAEYQIKWRQIKQLVFDCEPNTLTANRIQLLFKAAGQKVGLVEVSIRLIRENARATMAVVRK